jgi:hypothetical protein
MIEHVSLDGVIHQPDIVSGSHKPEAVSSRSAPVREGVLHRLFDGTTHEVTLERARGFLSLLESIVGPAITPCAGPPEGLNVSLGRLASVERDDIVRIARAGV